MKLLKHTVFVVLVSLALTNCTSEDNSGDVVMLKQSYDVKELNIVGLWPEDPIRYKMVEDVVREFEFRNQDIVIHLHNPDDIAFENNNEVQFVGNEVRNPNPKWDIVRLKASYGYVASYLGDQDWGEKYMVDFAQYPDFMNNHTNYIYSEGVKNDNGGIVLGPYNDGYYFNLWYNKELADEMGIEIKQFGMTPQDFIGYIKTAHEYNVSNNVNIIPYLDQGEWLTTEYLVMGMYFSQFDNVEEIQNIEVSEHKLDKLASALEVLEEMAKYNPLPSNLNQINQTVAGEYMINKKALFYTNASGVYTRWASLYPEKIKNMYPVEIPQFKSNAPAYFGGYQAFWGVPKNAPNKEAAIKFMKYWTRPDIAEKFVRIAKSPTAVRGALSGMKSYVDQFETFQATMTEKYGDNLLNAPDKRFYFGKDYKWTKIPYVEILRGELTAEMAMEQIQSQLPIRMSLTELPIGEKEVTQ